MSMFGPYSPEKVRQMIEKVRAEAARRKALEEAKKTGPPAPERRKTTSTSSRTSSSSTKTSSTPAPTPPTTKSIYDSKAWKEHTQSSQWSGVNVKPEPEPETVEQTPDDIYKKEQQKISTQRTELSQSKKEGHQVHIQNVKDTMKSRYDHAVAYQHYKSYPAGTTFKTESGETITRDQAISGLKDTFPKKGVASLTREYVDFKRDVKRYDREVQQYERDLDMWYRSQTRGAISQEDYDRVKSNIKQRGFMGLLATAFTPSDPLGLRSAYHVYKGDMDKAWDVKVSGVYDTRKPFHQFYLESPMGTVGKMYMLKGATMGIKYAAASIAKPIIAKTPAVVAKFDMLYPKATVLTKPIHTIGHKQIGKHAYQWARYGYVPFDKAVQTGAVIKTKGLYEVQKTGFKKTLERTFLPKTDPVIRQQAKMLSQKPMVRIGFPKKSPSGTGGELSMVSGGTWYKKSLLSAVRPLKYKKTSMFMSVRKETDLFKITKLASKPVTVSGKERVGDITLGTKSKLPWLKFVGRERQWGYVSSTSITESGKLVPGQFVSGDPSYSVYKSLTPFKKTVLQRVTSGFRSFKASDVASVSKTRTVGVHMRPLSRFTSIVDKRSFLYVPAEPSTLLKSVQYSGLLFSPRYETSMKPVRFSAPAVSSIQDHSLKSSKISMPVMGVASVSISDMDMRSMSLSKKASVQIQKQASVQLPMMKTASVYKPVKHKGKHPYVPGIQYMPTPFIIPKMYDDSKKVKKKLYDKKLYDTGYRFRTWTVPTMEMLLGKNNIGW